MHEPDVSHPDSSTSLPRTARLYPAYVALFNALFWMPVFFLYFSAHLSLDRVLQLEAVYYFAVVLLEVPSGYLSDRVGRKPTLAISALSLIAAYALFAAASTFAPLAVAQVLLAAGISFNSGTDTSLHYDALHAAGREAEYPAREAIAARALFLAGAAAAVVGGWVASSDLRWAYLLSLAAAVGLFGVVLAMEEPGGGGAGSSEGNEGREPARRASPHALPFLAQLRTSLGYLRQPALAWLFAFAVAMSIFIHIPYELYQPYLALLGDAGALGVLDVAAERLAVGSPVSAAPLAAGLHMAASMLVGAWFAGRSIRIRDRIGGTGRILLLALVVQVSFIGLMGWRLSPVIIGLVLLRGASRGLMSAPLNVAIAPRIPTGQRATYLSLQSLAGRLAFGLTLLSMAKMAGEGARTSWPALSGLLGTWAWIGGAVVVGLALTMRRAEVD